MNVKRITALSLHKKAGTFQQTVPPCTQ